MTQATIVDRMRSCLERHASLYETMMGDYAGLEQDIQTEDLAGLLERKQTHARECTDLAKEFDVLLREWHNASNVTTEQRSEIRQLSGQVEERIRELCDRHEKGIAAATQQLASLRDSLAEVRKGLAFSRRFRAGDEPNASLVDRKA